MCESVSWWQPLPLLCPQNLTGLIGKGSGKYRVRNIRSVAIISQRAPAPLTRWPKILVPNLTYQHLQRRSPENTNKEYCSKIYTYTRVTKKCFGQKF